MQVISTRVHALADYATAAALIIAPVFFLDASTTVPAWVLIGSGIVLLALSLLTRYELGLVKAIPMPVHLGMDGLLGAFLIASPWLLGFADLIWWPHVLVGIAELGGAFMTRRTSPEERLHGEAVAAAPGRP